MSFSHDSLRLELDRMYTLRLSKKRGKEYIYGSFNYEEYELSKNVLLIQTDEKEHFKNNSVKLTVSGKDENDLNLLDGRIEILLRPKIINQYFEQNVFIPDTLLFVEKKLSPRGDTEIIVSDSIFPKANFDYSIHVRMLTADNESISESTEVSYYYESEKFDIQVKTDSIYFQYLKNGRPEAKQVVVYSADDFGNRSEIHNGLSPFKSELKPYFSAYRIEAEGISENFSMSEVPSLIQCFSERTRDSVHIVVKNPRKIPFVYHIYKKNIPLAKGFSDTLTYKKNDPTKQNYYLSVSYLWGGTVKEENFKIPLMDEKLNIEVTEPRLVYPGQTSKIEILVSDTEGNPVEGTDLTAYSLTKKFNYKAPELPYLGKTRSEKRLINNYCHPTKTLRVFGHL